MKPFALLCLFIVAQAYFLGAYSQDCSRTNKQSNICAKSCNQTRSCKRTRDCVCDGDCGFSCVKRGMKCPKPRNIQNGRVNYKNTTLGSVAKYRCFSPYTVVGDRKRWCRGKGKWDGQEPSCKILCKDPGDIQHGTREHNGFELGMTVTYQCLGGLSLQGQATLTCKQNAEWDYIRPRCVCERTKAFKLCENSCNPENNSCGADKQCLCDEDCGYSCIPKALDCGRPPSLTNGRMQYSSTTFGANVTYQCDKPYTLVGTPIKRCRGIGKWDDKSTECKIMCRNPGGIQFGQVQVLGLEVGDQAFYSCATSYRLVGNFTLTCGATGRWDNVKPKCVEPTCGRPTIPEYSEVTWGKDKGPYRIGDRLMLKCKIGYFSRGIGIMDCGSKGWSNTRSTLCSPKSCGTPGDLINGELSTHVFTFKSKVSFRCSPGYKLVGDKYRQCQANQRWSGLMPTCEPIDCGQLPTPAKGKVIHSTGTKFEGTITIRCTETGYEITGSETRTCQDDGTWSGSPTSCTILSCGDPGTPNGGQQFFVSRRYEYGGWVEFKCDTNYTMTGKPKIYCRSNKRWDAPIPKCWAPCEDPGVPANGQRTGNDFRHEKSVKFQCPEVFDLEGSKKISCRNGTWSDKRPTCKVIKCNDPGTPKNGNQAKVINNYSYPGSVEFECSQDYTMRGKDVINCQRNKRWDGSVPECLAPCKDPGVPVNGTRSGDDFRHAKLVTFQCPDEFNLKGNENIYCQDGKWSGDRPTCEVIVCNDPGTPKDGNQAKVTNNYSYPGSVVFQCSQNYTLRGNVVINCQKNKRWDGNIPECLAPCKDPGVPANGTRRDGNNFGHGKYVTFQCPYEYNLKGKKRIQCKEGRWSDDIPTCEVIKCEDPGTPDHGRKAEAINNYFYGESVRFECYQNYTMQGKDVINCMRNNQWDHPIPTCLAPCKHPGTPPNGFIVGDNFTHGSTVRVHCLEDFTLQGASTVVCNNGKWDGEKPRCEACDVGFPLGMGNGQIPDRSISASSFQDAFHAPRHGRFGRDTYWCSTVEESSYIEIHLSKPYKITAVDIKVFDKKGNSKYALQTEFYSKWIQVYRVKPDALKVQRIQLEHPVISRSLRIGVQRKEDQPYLPVCISVEIYGCSAPRGCIMPGSVVIAKTGTSYSRAFVRVIKGDRFEAHLESPNLVPMVLKGNDVVLDEEPSPTELTKGMLVLGRDILSRQMKKGHLEDNLGSSWKIKSTNSLWKSSIKDIRVIKPEIYCKGKNTDQM